MMDALDRLVSWQAIYDLSCDYMRAQDRLDPALHIAVFHDDATTDYGAGWQGDAPGFVDFAQRVLTPHKANHHMIGQVRIDFESADMAFGEVYFQAHHRIVAEGGERVFRPKQRAAAMGANAAHALRRAWARTNSSMPANALGSTVKRSSRS